MKQSDMVKLEPEMFNDLPDNLIVEGQYGPQIVRINGEVLDPVPSQKVRNHSPDGFSWGYSGSGPAQLALAFLLKFLPEAVALELYQDFKSRTIAAWPRETFKTEMNLRRIIKTIVE